MKKHFIAGALTAAFLSSAIAPATEAASLGINGELRETTVCEEYNALVEFAAHPDPRASKNDLDYLEAVLPHFKNACLSEQMTDKLIELIKEQRKKGPQKSGPSSPANVFDFSA